MDAEKYMRALGVEIAAQMSIAGVTQKALVERTGISESTLRRYIKGTRDVPASSLLAIAREIGTPAHELVERAELRYDRQSTPTQSDYDLAAHTAPNRGKALRDRMNAEQETPEPFYDGDEPA